MSDWITSIIQACGYAGIVFLMALENIFPPIPSEVIMPLSGYLVSQDKFTLIGVILAGTLGTVLGTLPLYYLGYRLGTERLKEWSRRYGRWFAVSERDIDRGREWFDRYGIWTVFFLRLVPGLRSLISIPAGLDRMSMGSYLLFSSLGSALWCSFLAYLGVLLGNNFEQAKNYIGPVSTVILVVLLLLYIYRVVTWSDQRTQKKSS